MHGSHAWHHNNSNNNITNNNNITGSARTARLARVRRSAYTDARSACSRLRALAKRGRVWRNGKDDTSCKCPLLMHHKCTGMHHKSTHTTFSEMFVRETRETRETSVNYETRRISECQLRSNYDQFRNETRRIAEFSIKFSLHLD